MDPFFREVRAGDLRAVLPPHRWDDDPDLRLPPVGRKHDKPFEDGLPKPEKAPAVFVPAAPTAASAPPPKLEPPPPASVSVGVPGVSTIVGPSIPLGPAIPVGMPPVSPALPAAAATTALPGAQPHALPALEKTLAAPPVPAPPSGAAAGGDLLSLLAPDEVAALFSARVAFEEDAAARRTATAAAASACACEVDALEAWLRARGDAKAPERKRLPKTSKDASSKDAPREEGDVAAGLRRWLRDDAAAAATAARDARAAAAVPAAPARSPTRTRGATRFRPPRCAP